MNNNITDIEIINELGQIHPHIFDGIDTIMDAKIHYNLDESSIQFNLIKDLKLYTLTNILSIYDVDIYLDNDKISIKESNIPWSLSTILNGVNMNVLIRFATFRWLDMPNNQIVIIKL